MTSAAPVLDRRGDPVPVGAVAAAFGLRAGEVRAMPGGKNEHFVLGAGGVETYLRRSHRHKDPVVLDAQVVWTELLRDAGLPTPEFLRTADGSAVVVHDGRLWTASRGLPGTTPSPGDPDVPALLGRSTASVALLAIGLPPPPGLPQAPALSSEVRLRLAACPPDAVPDRVQDVAERLLADLDRDEAALPRGVVHGGARRASLRLDAGRVVGVLDFDSSRHDARLLDLATAVHDSAKPVGSREVAVGLELDRVEAIARAYGEVLPLEPAEERCLPAVLLARRLTRLLGRLSRIATGQPVSDNDRAKVVQEQQRLDWLVRHRYALGEALSPAAGPAGHQEAAG